MILSDHRMVEGQPLRYYYYYPRQEFTYFQQFDQYYPRNNMEEDLILPPSPHSVQSDSDNSISSVDVSSKPISVKKNMKKDENKEVQCCWRSCGIFFPTLDQLASHVSKVHASGGPGGLYYCGWEGCSRNNRGFNARYKMLVHVRTHTNEKPHQCYQCDKSFSRAENLKIHSRSHSGEKPYVCPVPGCNKAYSNSSDRFKHTRTHQVEKPYQCKVPGCPKRYTDPSSLRKHVKTYKHFITETEKEKKIETEIPRVPPVYSSEEESPKKHCECSHVCCNMSNCINKAAEIIRLGAIIKDNWMLDPFITEPKRLFTPYDLTPTSMEVDGPLDLSIHRKTL